MRHKKGVCFTFKSIKTVKLTNKKFMLTDSYLSNQNINQISTTQFIIF